MERLMIKGSVYACGLPGYLYPVPLQDVVKWANDLVDSVPSAYRDSAKFEIDVHEEHGDYETDINVTYTRPETDEEMNKRNAINETRRLKREEIKEARERELLKQLIEKYGEDK